MNLRSVQLSSLQTKLLVFAAALVVLPGVIYGVVSVSSARAALSRTVAHELAEEARNAAERLTATLRTDRENLVSFARQDVMREIRIGDLDKRISSFLGSLKRGNPACLDLLVLDRTGRVVASSNPALIGSAGGSPPAGAGAEHGIEGPLDASSHARRSLRFSVPVPDPDSSRESLGRLVALYDWERETAVAARMRENLLSVGLDTDVLLVDDRGVVIGGAPRPEGRWRIGEPVRLRVSRQPEGLSVPNGDVDRGAGVLFGHASLPDDLPPWSVIVAQPLSEALAPARRIGRLLALTLGGVLLVALAIALAAARRVTRPLAELTAAAEEIGRGRAARPNVPVRSRDEIGTLAAAFNRMSGDLGRAEQELVDAAKFAFVGELAAGVAHEVRTPLGVLQSSAQLLERSLHPTDEEARELLQLLRDEVHRIDRIVTGLLELGRPRTLQPAPSLLGQTVFHAVEFAEAQAREKHVTVHRHPLVPDPVVLCDPELIYQVALNLLVNAIQILPPGGTVDVAVLPARDGYAAFEIRDDGPGIPPDLRDRIFEPFFTRREGGSGLGLTFVRRVVQEHRGRITVDGAPEGGTIFRVELPVAEAA